MTFLVVAAFNPNSTLLNPSPKLGSIVACVIAFVDGSSLLQFDVLECWFFSSSTHFILFITARPIRSCLLLSSSCVDYLYTVCCRKLVMHLQFVCCYCILKCKKFVVLWAFMYWQPIGLLGRTRNGYTLFTDPSNEYHKVLFLLLSPLSLWMYVQDVDLKGNRNLHLQPFLKQDPLWQDECSSNLCFNYVSQTCIFPQNGSVSKAQPPFMWYKKVYAAMSNLAGESGIFVSGLLCCALLFGITVSLHLLRELFTISTLDMVWPHSGQNMMFPLTSLYNSLCLACLKSHSF